MKIDIRAGLSQKPDIVELGQIPNCEEFSRPFSSNLKDFQFTPAETHDMSPIPPQFQPAIHMALKSQPNLRDVWFHVQLRQGLLRPGSNFFGSLPHVDAFVPDNPFVKPYIPIATCLVSDTLQPVLFRQAFRLSADYISDVEYNAVIYKTIREQASKESEFTPAPYHMIRIGPFVAHKPQEICEPTQRTLLTVRFFNEPVPQYISYTN